MQEKQADSNFGGVEPKRGMMLYFFYKNVIKFNI